MEMLKLKSLVTEIIISRHAKNRLIKRFYEPSGAIPVLMRYRDENGVIQKEIVGSYKIPSDIRRNLKSDIQSLEYLKMDDDERYGIVVWVFKIVPTDSNLTFIDKETENKCVAELNKNPKNRLYFDYPVEEGKSSYGDTLFLIVQHNILKTAYFKPYVMIKKQENDPDSQFKKIYFIKDLIDAKLNPKSRKSKDSEESNQM